MQVYSSIFKSAQFLAQDAIELNSTTLWTAAMQGLKVATGYASIAEYEEMAAMSQQYEGIIERNQQEIA